MNPRFAILVLLLYTSALVSSGSSGEWQTSGTQAHSASLGCMILVLKQILEIIFKKPNSFNRFFYLKHDFKSVLDLYYDQP